ncbi:MAG: 30S ribosomal protein S17 [Christensenellaceae bacterium]|nr:30S ribosomal protein S17 [Christensenellaceae bacterium]MBR3843493.1 30S ribosomal protein S17 [Christensenellaceae bacterium]
MLERAYRKTRTGVVVSDKMDKTVVVAIKERKKHGFYSKVVNTTVKFKAHDENNECRVGDTVTIMETRPLSKDKHFRVVEIVEKAK